MGQLLSNHAFSIYVDRATRLVRFVRSSRPYASLHEFEQLHAAAFRAFDQIGRAYHMLLVDMRCAVMNTDPAFEQAAARVRPLMTRGFARAAVLVRTAVGALQVNRHLREDKPHKGVLVFQDEASALAFLLDLEPELDGQRRSGIIETSPSSAPLSPGSSQDRRRSLPPSSGPVSAPASSKAKPGRLGRGSGG